MATTGFWPVKSRLKEVIDYAENPDKTTDKKYVDEDLYNALRYVGDDDKTDKKMYVSAINCPTKRAYEHMTATKRRYGKLGGNVAYHGYQSFVSGEVTPEEAHKIGMETARRMWGGDYEIVVTTHLNTDNVHNHIVVNSVSFKTGRKFKNHISDHYKLREISDKVCAERGKSILPPSKFKGSRKKDYWVTKNGGMTHRDVLRRDIDMIIKNSSNWEFFKHNLKGLGYEIVRSDDYKHISVITKGWKRPVRIDSLGENYTIDAIRERLDYNRKARTYFIPVYRAETSPLLRLERELEFKIEHSHDAVTVIVDTLFYILLQLINLTRDQGAWGSGNQAHSPLVREAVTFEKQLEKEYFFLKNNDLHTIADITAFAKSRETEIAALEAERKAIRNSNRRPKSNEKRQQKLKAAREITKKIKPLRDELKLADSALKRYPRVWELLKTERDIELNSRTRNKYKERNYER